MNSHLWSVTWTFTYPNWCFSCFAPLWISVLNRSLRYSVCARGPLHCMFQTSTVCTTHQYPLNTIHTYTHTHNFSHRPMSFQIYLLCCCHHYCKVSDHMCTVADPSLKTFGIHCNTSSSSPYLHRKCTHCSSAVFEQASDSKTAWFGLWQYLQGEPRRLNLHRHVFEIVSGFNAHVLLYCIVFICMFRSIGPRAQIVPCIICWCICITIKSRMYSILCTYCILHSAL